MKIRQIMRMLESDGWVLVRQRGSHRQFRHSKKRGLEHLEAGRIEAMKFLIVIEKTKTGFSAYSPDLPGCVAAGATRRQTEATMKKAIKYHLEGMRAERMKVPAPHSYSAYVHVSA